MSCVIYPLVFDTAVHFAPTGQEGRLDAAGASYTADTLFSALCAELAAADEDAALERLYRQVMQGAIRFSDLMPWRRDGEGEMAFYLPRPVLSIPADTMSHGEGYDTVCCQASARKKQKSMKYIRASEMDAYVHAMHTGKTLASGAEVGAASLRPRVNTRGEVPLPYYVGQFDFHADAGLYLLLETTDEELADWMGELLTWLGMTGIGGKRSSGLGKFHIEEEGDIRLDTSEDGIYTDDAALCALLAAADAPWQMALSPVLPTAGDLAAVKEGAYHLRRAGGFITDPRHAAVKKNSVCLIDAGSCLRTRVAGSLCDLGTRDGHPVWRYGFGLYAGVTA